MTRSEFESKISSALNEFLGHEEYKHWVFSAGKFPENEEVIKRAKKAVKNLKDLWEMNASIHGHYEGPEFTIHEDGSNVEIEAVSSNLRTLINGCMAFAREMERYVYKDLIYLSILVIKWKVDLFLKPYGFSQL